MSERRFQEPRRRGLDTRTLDADRPRRFGAPGPHRQVPSGPPIRATVKWFSAAKGFGFVVPEDGSGDAFLHTSVVERSGQDAAALQPGATLRVTIGPGLKGPQVTEILEVDASTIAASPEGRPADHRMGDHTPIRMTGTVKWYSPEKRFGFVAVDSGRREVFVHASVLQRSRIVSLSEGQRVEMQVAEGQKGLEALSISLT